MAEMRRATDVSHVGDDTTRDHFPRGSKEDEIKMNEGRLVYPGGGFPSQPGKGGSSVAGASASGELGMSTGRDYDSSELVGRGGDAGDPCSLLANHCFCLILRDSWSRHQK
ncbi:hypothetical protein QOT17_007928 [Balamuthia mandrillaris]